MKILLIIAIIINIAVTLSLASCMFYSKIKDIKSKVREILGYTLGYSTVLYLAILAVITAYGLIKLHYETLILAPFIFAPFIIGHYANYDKMYKYTCIQIITFLASLAILSALLIITI